MATDLPPRATDLPPRLYAPDAATASPNKHQSLPLRLSQAELNAVVEGTPIACTHFDAFRFFTPQAAPLNTVQPLPSRDTQPALEQPGCVHGARDTAHGTSIT